MTTGRINQVASLSRASGRTRISWRVCALPRDGRGPRCDGGTTVRRTRRIARSSLSVAVLHSRRPRRRLRRGVCVRGHRATERAGLRGRKTLYRKTVSHCATTARGRAAGEAAETWRDCTLACRRESIREAEGTPFRTAAPEYVSAGFLSQGL